MLDIVASKNDVPIRLTDERWAHMETVVQPGRILAGRGGELLAVREIEVGKFLVVVYRELENDGFIITAFLTRNVRSLDRRQQLWP